MKSQETKQQALLMRQQGFSVPQISRELSIPERTIQRWTANIKAGSIPMTYNQNVYTKEDKAENRFRILYNRGQSTKQELLRYLSSLYETEDKYSLNNILANTIKRLHERGEEFHIIPDVLANTPPEQLTHLNSVVQQTIAYIKEQCNGSIIAEQYVLSCLGSDVQASEAMASHYKLLTSKREWNIPVHQNTAPIFHSSPPDITEDIIPY